eukprot:s3622_g7.t1
MGSTVEATPAVEVCAPTVTGELPTEGVEQQPEMNAVEAAAKRSDGVSPMTPLNEEKKYDSDEDAEAVRAAKRARLGDEEEKEELVVDAKSIRLAMEGIQRALDYVARQQVSIGELQRQILEIGSTANHSESCQRYSLVCVQKAAEDLKDGVWQLTGNKHEEKTTLKSMVQQLVTAANNGNAAVKKLSENIHAQSTQFGEQFKQFADCMLQLQGQVADAFSAAQRGAPAPSTIPSFPPVVPVTPGVPVAEGTMPIYGSMSAAVPAASVPAPPVPPPMTPRPRGTVNLSLRMSDGTVQNRAASPTPHHNDLLRTNPGYALCSDGAYRRLL